MQRSLINKILKPKIHLRPDVYKIIENNLEHESPRGKRAWLREIYETNYGLIEDELGIYFEDSFDVIWKDKLSLNMILKPKIHLRPDEYEFITQGIKYHDLVTYGKQQWIKLILDEVENNHCELVADVNGIFYEQSGEIIWSHGIDGVRFNE